MSTIIKSFVSTIAVSVFALGLSVAPAAAQVTGDFKVLNVSYLSDVTLVRGSMNHGAVQSGKDAQVEFSFTYSFTAEREDTIEGDTQYIFVPGKCVNAPLTDQSCYYQKDNGGHNKGDRIGAPSDGKWAGEWTSIVTEPKTVIVTINGAGSGLVAVYEPIVVKGRINPKGKLTGYDWTATTGISASNDIVDPALVPEGFVITSVTINQIDFKAYLVDKAGVVFADTIVTGTLFTGGQ